MASVFKRGGKNNRGGSYYIAWYDHTGKRRVKSAKTTDKATAERIGKKLEPNAALRRERVIDTTMESIQHESDKPIEDQIQGTKTNCEPQGAPTSTSRKHSSTFA